MSVSYSFDPTGVLTFTGDAANDYLEIRDTGRAGPGNVSYRTSTSSQFRVINEDVWKIAINTRGGNDTVVHRMAGKAAGLYREVDAKLGTGNDVFDSTIAGNVQGSNGMRILANGEYGNDRLTGRMNGDIRGGAMVGFSFHGGEFDAGVDFMNVFADQDVDIDSTSILWSNMSGGSGNDNMQLRYNGELDGGLLFNLEGQDGSDWVRAHSNLNAGSSGYLGGGGYSPSRVSGGAGSNDTVEFGVRNLAAGNTATVTAEISGGAGTDNFARSALWVTVTDWVAGETLTALPN
jgi:hypothetical protein